MNNARILTLLSSISLILDHNRNGSINALTIPVPVVTTSTTSLYFKNTPLDETSALISNTNLNLFIGNKDKTISNGEATFSKITTIHSPREFLDFLNEDDRLCIVKFYASWCKSCKKFDIRLRKFTHLVADQKDGKGNLLQKGSVRVATVEIAANAKLCQKLQITKLPYIQLYKGDDGLIDGFVCPPKEFHILVEKVNELLLDDNHDVKLQVVDKSCNVGNGSNGSDEDAFFVKEVAYK